VRAENIGAMRCPAEQIWRDTESAPGVIGAFSALSLARQLFSTRIQSASREHDVEIRTSVVVAATKHARARVGIAQRLFLRGIPIMISHSRYNAQP